MKLPSHLAVRLVTVTIVFLPQTGGAQKQPGSENARAQTLAQLAAELRWNNEPGKQHYFAIRDDLTQRLFGELDRFVSEIPAASTVTPSKLKEAVDNLLGRRGGELPNNVAFSGGLPSRFLVMGVELQRGGPAIAEDAVSFRAYRETGDKLALVTHTDDLRSASGSPYLVGLRAKAFPRAPVAGEFWFLAWAEIPPQAPPTVTMRLYAFDGQSFRPVWAPMDFIAPGLDEAAKLTADGGFIVSRMPDWRGPKVVNEQYALTTEGPQKVAEWETDIK